MGNMIGKGTGPDVRKTTTAIFFAMLVSIGAYAVVAAVGLGQAAQQVPAEAASVVRLVFIVLAALSTIGSLVVPKFVAGGPREAITDQKYLTGRILAWGFSESIGILGVVGAFLGLGGDLVWTLIAWSALVMLINAPRAGKANR